MLDSQAGPANPRYSMVTSLLGKKCPESSQRTHRLAIATVAQCAESCFNRTNCQYFSTDGRFVGTPVRSCMPRSPGLLFFAARPQGGALAVQSLPLTQARLLL